MAIVSIVLGFLLGHITGQQECTCTPVTVVAGDTLTHEEVDISTELLNEIKAENIRQNLQLVDVT